MIKRGSTIFSKFVTSLGLASLMSLVPTKAFCREKSSDILYQATDGNTQNPFVENPALLDPNKFFFSLLKLRTTNEYQVTSDPEGDNTTFKYSITRDTTGLSYLEPIGGGATIGITGEATKNELTSRHPDFFRDTKEIIHDRHAAFRVSLDLTPSLRAGFSYNYYSIAADVDGHWFASSEDRLEYTSTLYGYTVGARYSTAGPWTIHASHRPSSRGRSIIDGEQLIFTESGITSIGGFTKPAGGISYGLELRRWFYQRANDQRADQVTTKVNGRSALLNGVDMEQFYYPIEAYTLSGVYAYSQNLDLNASLTSEQGALFYRANEDIGNRKNEENRFTNLRLKYGGQYKHGNYTFYSGVIRHFRSKENISARASIFFDSTFKNYAGTEHSYFLGVNLTR